MTAAVPGRAGFTLTETLVVLLLLGLATAASVPALRSVLEPGPDASAREMAEVFRRAREAASVRGVPTLVTVDPRSGLWRLFAAGGYGTPLDQGNLLSGRPGTRLTMPGGEPVTARFDPRGRSRVPAVSVWAGDRVWHVEVDPWTSSVRIR